MTQHVRVCHASIREGSTLTELLIAATLLVALMGTFAPLSVQSGRLWQDTRHHQLALDELSNHLGFLIAMPEPQRREQIQKITPSDAITAALPGVSLTAEEIQDIDGHRLIVNIDWERPVTARPLTLVGWIDTTPRETGDE